jgi:membrane associated rhomboid family serine protease
MSRLPSLFPSELAWVPYQALAIVVVLVFVGVAMRRLTGRRFLDPLRKRLLFGVPWGTLLTIGLVLSVFLFLQGAWWHPRNPLVVPFRTWSYYYPLGMFTGAFTHGGQGHLVGNLLGTLAYGTVVEYAWGHYPNRRGTQSFTSLSTNPFARILAIPLAAFVVGVFTGLFAVGPVVGFSGVVFALAGFALVVRPYLFLGAIFANRVLDLVVTALRFPQPTVSGSTRFVTPWWADIAIQGHAIGILAGVLLAGAFLRVRDERPDPIRVFAATLVFAVFQGLWAIYLPQGNSTFTLFRWAGTALVFVLALVVAAAVEWADDPFVVDGDLNPRVSSGAVLAVLLLALTLAAVPANLATIDADDVPEDGIEVRDYVVTYDEDVQNAYTASIWVPVGQEQTQVNESGVIVASDEREVWWPMVQKGELAVDGKASVVVGGVGWRETVHANRTSWIVLGNDSVYRVQLRREGGPRQTAYTSPQSTVDATVAGRNITLQPTDENFELVVTRDGETIDSGGLPANMTQAEIGGVTFDRNRTNLYAKAGGSRVKIAEKRN